MHGGVLVGLNLPVGRGIFIQVVGCDQSTSISVLLLEVGSAWKVPGQSSLCK